MAAVGRRGGGGPEAARLRDTGSGRQVNLWMAGVWGSQHALVSTAAAIFTALARPCVGFGPARWYASGVRAARDSMAERSAEDLLAQFSEGARKRVLGG